MSYPRSRVIMQTGILRTTENKQPISPKPGATPLTSLSPTCPASPKSPPSASPPPSANFYRVISTRHYMTVFSAIIFGNLLVSCFICLNLWGFARHDDLTRWEKRTFNSITLLLSGSLGFGIGFLCDRIGLLARGKLLQSRENSADDVSCKCDKSLGTPCKLLM